MTVTQTVVTKEMLLGTLTHRAVLWAFVEPVHGPRLWEMKSQESFANVVRRNVIVLTRGLRAQSTSSNTELITPDVFSALVDRTGGTSEVFDHVKGLSGRDLMWVMQKLPTAAESAARALAADFSARSYLTMRSEVPTQDLDWMPERSQTASHQRLDLIGLAEDGVLEIIELKVTSHPNSRDGNDFPQLRKQFAAVRARLGDASRPLRARLLYIHVDGATPTWRTFADERR
jgi:hypothetical protein